MDICIPKTQQEIEAAHKRNLVLINTFSENWLALLVAIVGNVNAGRALIEMRVKEYKTPEKNPIKLARHDWNVLDKQIAKMKDEGLSIREIAENLEIPENTLWSRIRKQKKKARCQK